MDQVEVFKQAYNEYGAWIVAAAGFTPFPYKVITILSGMTDLNLDVFAIASILSRGGRFFLLAVLLWKFGAPMQVLSKKSGLAGYIVLCFACRRIRCHQIYVKKWRIS